MFTEANISHVSHNLHFAEHKFILDADASIFWVEEKTLIIADLHLGNTDYSRNETCQTLIRLKKLIQTYQAEKIICLSNSMEEITALSHMDPDDYAMLVNLCSTIKSWDWVISNYELKTPIANLYSCIRFSKELILQSLLFTYNYVENADFPQIIGNCHPKAAITTGDNPITGKAFLISDSVLMLPAFNNYEDSQAHHAGSIKTILGDKNYHCFLLKQNQIWQIK